MKTYYLPALIFLLFTSCKRETFVDRFYEFPDHMWHRFDLLKYELPVDKTGIHVRIEVYARHTTSFPYDNLDFNMVLYTPSGEERIREFRLKIKDGSGAFSGSLSDGVYTVAVVTHKDLNISKEGNLKVELENLIPKLETPGLTGIGIRLTEL